MYSLSVSLLKSFIAVGCRDIGGNEKSTGDFYLALQYEAFDIAQTLGSAVGDC